MSLSLCVSFVSFSLCANVLCANIQLVFSVHPGWIHTPALESRLTWCFKSLRVVAGSAKATGFDEEGRSSRSPEDSLLTPYLTLANSSNSVWVRKEP